MERSQGADVRALVESLAQVEPGQPVVTLYVDARWRDEQQRERVRLFFSERAREARQLFGGRPDLLVSVERLGQFVEALVNQDVMPDARGLMLVASEAHGLFELVEADAAFESAMFVDDEPRLYPLIEALVNERPALLATVESGAVELLELQRGRVVDGTRVEREVPRRHAMGGWSQRKFQRHVKEHIRVVWKEGAKLLERLAREDRTWALVLFGQEPSLRGFARELPAWLVQRVVGMRPLPHDRRTLLEEASSALDEERMSREFAAVHAILRQGLSERSGTVGLGDTLLAVNERRLRLLAVTHRFDARGYRCTGCDALWDAGATGCVFCGATTRLVHLREELVRRALLQGSEVVVVPEASPLNAYRGIGGLMRHLSGDEHQSLGSMPSVSEAFARSVTT
jgi:peptide chain release factor subunit 1